MNKKVVVIALVLVLAVGSVFAAKKSADIKVGAQLGYGGRSVTLSGKGDIKDYKLNSKNGGFYGAFTFEMGLTDDLSIKAEAGINAMGKEKVKNTLGKYSHELNASDNSPVSFTLFAGAMYNMELSKELTMSFGAGVDMMMGKLSSDEDAKSNTAIGLGAEAGVAYAINNQISITGGAKFGWHFINTNPDVEDYKEGDTYKTSNVSYKFFAGVTYAL